MENVWFVGGGSGHGFKHGPAVGEYVGPVGRWRAGGGAVFAGDKVDHAESRRLLRRQTKESLMRRVSLLLICAVCFSPLLRAQKLKDDISCYSDHKDNAPHKKKLWDGYEISLGPSRDPEAVEEKCTAAIYNSTGRVVFRTNGFNVVFDEEQTGKDLDRKSTRLNSSHSQISYAV